MSIAPAALPSGRVRPCLVVAALLAGAVACGTAPADPVPADTAATAASTGDAQHAGITTPHGDHSPHHGGLVLMNGETHYEVVMRPEGRVELWLSDAIREDLPASLASRVEVTVTPGTGQPRRLPMAIDDAGESWAGTGPPFPADPSTTVKVAYTLKGEPHEVEIPYTPATAPVTPPAP